MKFVAHFGFMFVTFFHILLIPFLSLYMSFAFCMFLFNFVYCVFYIAMFTYSYCYVCAVLCILNHCVVPWIVCKCVLYYCHRSSTQLQLTNTSYHATKETQLEDVDRFKCFRTRKNGLFLNTAISRWAILSWFFLKHLLLLWVGKCVNWSVPWLNYFINCCAWMPSSL